jgi:hypothetical protein
MAADDAAGAPTPGLREQLSDFADQHGQMMDAAAKALRDKFGEAKASLYADAMGFVHAIDFTERWILALLAFHVAVWLTIVATRAHANAQAVLFLLIAGAICGAERLNALGAARWESFAGQDYFDKHGVFMAVLWGAPLLGDLFLIILLALRSSVTLLVKVKRAELKQNRKAAARSARRKAD